MANKKKNANEDITTLVHDDIMIGQRRHWTGSSLQIAIDDWIQFNILITS